MINYSGSDDNNMLFFADNVTIHTSIEKQKGQNNLVIENLLNQNRVLIVYSINHIYLMSVDNFELLDYLISFRS